MEERTHELHAFGLTSTVAPDGRRMARVLHVENDRYVFLAIKEVMLLYEFAAIHNVHSPDLSTAVRVLGSTRHFDLIITDHSPATLDGAEVIRLARSLPHRAGIPILMLASVLEGYPPLAAVGANALLGKPPDLQMFKETVEWLLRSARSLT